MIGILVLAAFIKMSLHVDSVPGLAIGYTVIMALVQLMFGSEVVPVLIAAAITLVLMWIFFFLLKKFEGTGMWMVTILVFLGLTFGLSFAF